MAPPFLALIWAPAALALVAHDRTWDSSCAGPRLSFPDFIKKFGRKYKPGTEEYEMRHGLFLQAMDDIADQNCGQVGGDDWRKGFNKFADYTLEEMMALQGWVPEPSAASELEAAQPEPVILDSEAKHLGLRRSGQVKKHFSNLPRTFDWGNLNAVQQETNQGRCGSCWAVAAETNMRAHREIVGSPTQFSIDTLVSCVPNPLHCGGKGGCKGATAALAYEYSLKYGLPIDESGLEPESMFGEPPECPDTQTPKNKTLVTEGVITGKGHWLHMPITSQKVLVEGRHLAVGGQSIGLNAWLKVARNDVQAFKEALVNIGPITISVAAGRGWQLYDSGVMSRSGCAPDWVMGHGVLAYGYGETTEGRRFWMIKNSWGNDWGENGRMRLQRDDDEAEEHHCGWNNKPEVGSGCDGGPKKVWVCGSCGILYDGALPIFKAPDTLAL